MSPRLLMVVFINAAGLLFLGCASRQQHISVGNYSAQLQKSTVSTQRPTLAMLTLTFSTIHVGQSEGAISDVLEHVFTKDNTNNLSRQFQNLLPYTYTNSSLVSVWKSGWTEPDGWPQVILAIFTNTNKIALADALWYANGGVRPIVNGDYNRDLHSLKVGDSIEMIYQYLGTRQGNYYKGKDGRWRVKFDYCGYLGRYIIIEIDAGDGRITYIGDGTL